MTAECTVCLNTGPVLMPVRYAIVPDAVSQALPGWAEPATAFPQLNGYHYALRCMRQGFIYVYYDTGAKDLLDWEVWNVDEKGDLYRTPNVLGAKQIFNPHPCGRPVHQATNLEHMALSENALQYKTWVAFSHAPWTQQAIENYTHDDTARAQRMQNILPAEWRSHIIVSESGLTKASEALLGEVLDYQPGGPVSNPRRVLSDTESPERRVSYTEKDKKGKVASYHFDEKSIRPHTTFTPWLQTRSGNAAKSIKAMTSRSLEANNSPVQPIMIALQDPVGIVHELAYWSDSLMLAQQRYQNELSVEFATWRNINTVKNQLQQMTAANFDNSVRLQGDTPRGDYPAANGAFQTEESTAEFRTITIARSWDKYAAKLDSARFSQFTDTFNTLCATIAGYLTPLVNIRVMWLQDARFIRCTEDHATTETDDNIHYRQIVGYAISSLNLASTGRQIVEEWIAEYSVEKKSNLFWRSLFFNNPAALTSSAPLLAEMKQESAKKDEEEDEESDSVLRKLTAFIAKLGGQTSESFDRANEALEKIEKAVQSGKQLTLLQQVMSTGDRWLLTCADRALGESTLGRKSGTALEGMFNILFLAQSGVSKNQILQKIKKSQWGKAARKQWVKLSHKKIKLRLKESFKIADGHLNTYKNLMKQDGALRVSNVKVLGMLFAMLELTTCKREYEKALKEAQKKGDKEAEKELTKAGLALSSAGLWVVSWGTQAILPSLQAMASNTPQPFTLPALSQTNGVSTSSRVFMAGKLIASGAGSAASILAVGVDFMELEKARSRSGTSLYIGVGVAGIKLASDMAYAIQITDGLLSLLGMGIFDGLMALSVTSGMPVAVEFVIGLTIRTIGFLASWPVMIAVNIVVPILAALFVDNELQMWCEKCVFGKETELKNTNRMSVEKRRSIEEAEQDNFIKTMHEMFGAPLSPKLQHEQDEREEKFRLKQEEYFKLRHAMKY